MKASILLHLAVALAQNDNEAFIKNSVNKIESITAPGSVKPVPIQGAGSIAFTTKSFTQHQETFVLVKSPKQEFKSPYNILAKIRIKTGLDTDIYDSDYNGRIVVTSAGERQFNVEVTGVDDTDFYVIFSITDPFDGPIETEVDDYMYQANIYAGEVGVEYIKIGDQWLLFGYQEATSTADLSFSAGLPFSLASSDQIAAAGLSHSGTVIVAQQPSDDWFNLNRKKDTITVSSPFSTATVLRFFNGDDVHSNVNPVLVGWQIEFACGPVPADAAQVELIAGKSSTETQVIGKKDVSDFSRNAEGNLEFSSIEATSDMLDKAGGLTCRFFSNLGRNLGMTAPSTYIVHDEESPRPNFEVNYLDAGCGLVVDVEQEIATCQVPASELASVFPPVLLQWEVNKIDGSQEFYPENPVQTTSLALNIGIVKALEGATIECLDRRAKDPNNPADITPSPAGRTVPQNPSAFKFRKYTFQVNVEVSKNSEPVCTSDTFHTETSAENPCSDVLKWEEPEMVICPFTKTPGNVTCTAHMVNGDTNTKAWENPDCIAYTEGQVPCEDSVSYECPPPGSESEAEAGGSMIWLLFFVFAAIGGAVLVFINKRGNKDDSTKKVPENSDETDRDEENSLLNETGNVSQSGSQLVVEDEVAPKTEQAQDVTQAAVINELAEQVKKVPLIDEYPDEPVNKTETTDEPVNSNMYPDNHH